MPDKELRCPNCHCVIKPSDLIEMDDIQESELIDKLASLGYEFGGGAGMVVKRGE